MPFPDPIGTTLTIPVSSVCEDELLDFELDDDELAELLLELVTLATVELELEALDEDDD